MFRKIIKGLKDVWCGTLEFDTEPKKGSFNPVTSGGVYEAINGAGGAKEIVYFEVDPSDPPSGLYDDITVALSNDKEPVIKIDGDVYFYTSTGTDKYIFVGGYNTEVVNYKTVTVSDDDSVVMETVDTIEGMVFPLYYHSNDGGFTVADKTGHALTKTEIADAYRAGQIFMFSSYPASNTQAHWGYCCDINIESDNTGYAEFFILAAFGGDSYEWEKYRINLSSGTEFVTLWGPNTSYSTGYSGYYADGATTVSVSTTQNFNSTQKAKGRANIGAASASDVTALQSQVSSLSDVSAYSVKGEATVSQLNAGPSGIQAGWAYQLTDSGTLTDGSLAVVAGDTVAWDGTKWFPLVKSDYYATKTYAQNVAHSIAPPFDPTRTIENPYKAGEPVTYTDGKVYVFTANHYGEWTGTDVLETNLSKMLGISNKELEELVGNAVGKVTVTYGSPMPPSSESGHFWNYTNGSVGSLEGYYQYNLIDVSEHRYAEVTNFEVGAGNAGIVFFDCNNSFVGGIKPNTAGDVLIQVPLAACYMGISSKRDSVTVYLSTSVTYTYNRLPSVEKFVDNIKPQVCTSTVLEWSENQSVTWANGKYYNRSTGELGNSANYYYSDLIDVSSYDFITVTNVTDISSGSAGFVFFDENKNYITGYAPSNGDVTFEVPAGAKYLGLSNKTDSSYYKYPTSVDDNYNVIPAIQSNLSYLQNFVDNIKPQVCTSTVLEWSENQSVTWANGKYYNRSTGELGNNADYFYSNLIDVSAYKSLKVTNVTDISGAAGFAFFDENERYISGILPANGDVEFELPAGTKYVGLSNKTDSSYYKYPVTINESYDVIPKLKSDAEYVDVNFFRKNSIRMYPEVKNLGAVCFTWDDGWMQYDSAVVSKFDSYNAKCGFAIIKNGMVSTGSKDYYIKLQRRGYSLLNHSINADPLSSYATKAAALAAISEAKNYFENNGMLINGWVCPGNQYVAEYRDCLGYFHGYAFGDHGTGEGIATQDVNTKSQDILRLRRWQIENATTTLQDVKDIIDECATNGYLLVFYGHAARLTNPEYHDIDWYDDVLNYIQTKYNNGEIFFGSPDECIRYYYDV